MYLYLFVFASPQHHQVNVVLHSVLYLCICVFVFVYPQHHQVNVVLQSVLPVLPVLHSVLPVVAQQIAVGQTCAYQSLFILQLAESHFHFPLWISGESECFDVNRMLRLSRIRKYQQQLSLN